MNTLELKLWRRALRSRRRPVEEPAAQAAQEAPRRARRKSGPGGPTAAAARKAWRERQVAGGKCADCGRPRGEDGTTRVCRDCANRRNAYKVARVKELQSEGRCMTCHKARGDDGTRWHCRPCADKHNVYTKRAS